VDVTGAGAHRRQVAKALQIYTANATVEHRFVRVGGIDQWIQLPACQKTRRRALRGPARQESCP